MATAGDDGAAKPPVARVLLNLGRVKGAHEFDEVSVSTDDPEHVTVVLASADGSRKIAIMLPRAEVKRLLSWRMVMSL